MHETIFALSTPSGGALSVIRLSGNRAIEIVQSLFKGNKPLRTQASHTAHFGTIVSEDEPIDEVILTLFHQGASYTGEEVVEISCHGSSYIVQRILHLLAEKGGRYAEAGEFTRRAFLNGKIDLIQAEAVADVIATESKAQHKAALHQLRGHFSSEIKTLRSDLIDFATLLELEIDFSEEDIEFAKREDLQALLKKTTLFIERLIHSFQHGNAIKEGVKIVLTGAPNAGKSTLFNALIEEDKAIVSPFPGTTRDIVEDRMKIDGILFHFLDTAGLRESEDAIENIGIEKAKTHLASAHTIVQVIDAQQYVAAKEIPLPTMNEGQHCIRVINKIDAYPHLASSLPLSEDYVGVSALQKIGIATLKQRIATPYLHSVRSEQTIVTNARHHTALVSAHQELLSVAEGIAHRSLTADMLAWHLRQALHHLAALIGEVHSDDILTHIFSRFCIGK